VGALLVAGSVSLSIGLALILAKTSIALMLAIVPPLGRPRSGGSETP